MVLVFGYELILCVFFGGVLIVGSEIRNYFLWLRTDVGYRVRINFVYVTEGIWFLGPNYLYAVLEGFWFLDPNCLGFQRGPALILVRGFVRTNFLWL